MSREQKRVARVLASFGEGQFVETGAQAVEVLRLKAATVRKHFARLRGITYLVAVVSRDRVRVYFFDAAGNMLLAENIDHGRYSAVRRTSRLIKRFERPRPPTAEELRIEATEDLRRRLSDAVRRVSRFLAVSPPDFPTVFVTRRPSGVTGQGFGLLVEDDALVFEEDALQAPWSDGVIYRAAFLCLLDRPHARLSFSQCVGNAVAMAVLRDTARQEWRHIWMERTGTSDWAPVVRHLVRHVVSYDRQGLSRLLATVQQAAPTGDPRAWMAVLHTLHECHEVGLSTSDFHLIKGFLDDLESPHRLGKRRHVLESVHLAPRPLVDAQALGHVLSVSVSGSAGVAEQAWADIVVREGARPLHVTVVEDDGPALTHIEYVLFLDGIVPKSGGPLAHGADVVHWALRRLRHAATREPTFVASIEMTDARLTPREQAVLERLASGDPEVLANTLVGSADTVASLVQAGRLSFLPDFYHLGLPPQFYVHGPPRAVRKVCRETCVEATLFDTGDASHCVVSAPAQWSRRFLEAAADSGLAVYPVVSASSPRRLIRDEQVFPPSREVLMWSDGPFT